MNTHLDKLILKNITLDNFCDLSNDNVEKIRKWRNSSDVKKFMFTQNEITAIQQKEFIEKLRTDKSRLYFLASLNGEPIGSIYFYNVDFDQKECYWGYYLDPKLIGASYGLILEYAVAEVVFEILRLENLFCEGFFSNKVAIKIHREFGFEEIQNDSNIILMLLRKGVWTLKKASIEYLISKLIS
jgi:UDP-4-amino-4,6-dideoxy-N-acetyl-beta-L-altrosamine N-acetyltransferase